MTAARTHDDVERRLLEWLEARRGRPVAADARLDALGIDSVEMAGVLRELEGAFDIRVDETVFDVDTVRDLARYVRERR